MTLGELKKSLNRFSGDLDDVEVIFTFIENNKPNFDNLAFVAYSEIPDEKGTVVVLGTMAAAIDRMKKGHLKYADGRDPKKEGFDLPG